MQSIICRIMNTEPTNASVLSVRADTSANTAYNYVDTAYAVSFFAYSFYSYLTYRFYLNKQFHMPCKAKSFYAAVSA